MPIELRDDDIDQLLTLCLSSQESSAPVCLLVFRLRHFKKVAFLRPILEKGLLTTSNCEILRYASEQLQDDARIVLKAVSQNGGALEYASERLRGDKDIVLVAVDNRGMALRYASPELCADRT